MSCPTCSSRRRLPLPVWVAAASVTSPAAWARLAPLDAKIVRAVRTSQQQQDEEEEKEEQAQVELPPLGQQQSEELDLELAQPDPSHHSPSPSHRISCAFSDSCSRPASVWCGACDSELCDRHDGAVHALALAQHARIPMADRVKARQARLVAALEAAGSALKQTARVSILQLRRALAEQDLERERTRRALGRLEAAAGRLDTLGDAQAQRHEAEVARLLMQPAPVAVADPNATGPAAAANAAPVAVDGAGRVHEPLRDAVSVAISEAAGARSRSPSAAASAYSARSAHSARSAQSDQSAQSAPVGPVASSAAPSSPGLLSSLSDDLLVHLRRFLDADGVALVSQTRAHTADDAVGAEMALVVVMIACALHSWLALL